MHGLCVVRGAMESKASAGTNHIATSATTTSSHELVTSKYYCVYIYFMIEEVDLKQN